jgi:hypothetical protein
MVKLLLCLFSVVALAAVMLQLRQQRLELSHQNNVLHNAIESHQSKLWSQQLQIAVYTAPNAISKTVGEHALKMVPRTPLPAGQTHWMDARPLPQQAN